MQHTTFADINSETASVSDCELLDTAHVRSVAHTHGCVYVSCSYEDGSEYVELTVRGRPAAPFMATVRREANRVLAARIEAETFATV